MGAETGTHAGNVRWTEWKKGGGASRNVLLHTGKKFKK